MTMHVKIHFVLEVSEILLLLGLEDKMAGTALVMASYIIYSKLS